MLLRRAKGAVATAIGAAVDLDAIIRRSRARYVMAYHRVISRVEAERDHVHSAMWVSPQTFEVQLAWMQSVGEVVDYRRILDFATPNSKPLFAITFDDGWLDTYQVAYPVLRELGYPALVFLVSGAMDSGQLFWPEDVVTKTHHVAESLGAERVRAALLALWPDGVPRPSTPASSPGGLAEEWVEVLKLVPEGERADRVQEYYRRLGLDSVPLQGYLMDWHQAREMLAAGIEFGSHTHTHRILKGLPAHEIVSEARRSREVLAEQLQVSIDTFCYPNARFDGREGAILAQCGYRYAFRIDSAPVERDSNSYYVPRYLMSEIGFRNRDAFRLHLLRAPLFAGRPNDPNRPG